MDIADLVTLDTVLRLGSMNRAAAELNTVQSNISARLKALEHELGVPLLQRHARGVVATPAGQRVHPYAARLVKLVADAKSAAIDEGEPNGTLAIGALETTTALRLSPILAEYSRRFRAVRLVLSTGTTSALVQRVLDAKLDGAFVAGPIDHPDLLHETVFTEELVLVTAPTIESASELSRVADLRIVVFQLGCSYRQHLETYLRQQGLVSSEPLAFGALDAVISCVAAGVGVTLLPRGVVAPFEQAGQVRLHALPGSQRHVDTVFVRRQDGYRSSAQIAFVALASQHYQATQATQATPAIQVIQRPKDGRAAR